MNLVWNRNYMALQEYFKEHGTCNVRGKDQYQCTLVGMGDRGEDIQYKGKLGNWLMYQRAIKKRNSIIPHNASRIAKLQILVDEGWL